MTDSKKRKAWITVTIVFFVSLGVLFSLLSDSAKALDNTSPAGLDYPNMSPDFVPNSPTPTPIVTQTPQSSPIQYCIIGADPSCTAAPPLVPDSDGQWAFFIMNGIYFEYPSTWRLERSGNDQFFYLVPTPDSPEGSKAEVIALYAASFPIQDRFRYDPLTFPQTLLRRPAPIWNRLISLTDFEGSEFLWQASYDQSFIYQEAIFYDRDTQMLIDFLMAFKKDQIGNAIYHPKLAKGQFPNFQHIIESFRYQRP